MGEQNLDQIEELLLNDADTDHLKIARALFCADKIFEGGLTRTDLKLYAHMIKKYLRTTDAYSEWAVKFE